MRGFLLHVSCRTDGSGGWSIGVIWACSLLPMSQLSSKLSKTIMSWGGKGASIYFVTWASPWILLCALWDGGGFLGKLAWRDPPPMVLYSGWATHPLGYTSMKRFINSWSRGLNIKSFVYSNIYYLGFDSIFPHGEIPPPLGLLGGHDL